MSAQVRESSPRRIGVKKVTRALLPTLTILSLSTLGGSEVQSHAQKGVDVIPQGRSLVLDASDELIQLHEPLAYAGVRTPRIHAGEANKALAIQAAAVNLEYKAATSPNRLPVNPITAVLATVITAAGLSGLKDVAAGGWKKDRNQMMRGGSKLLLASQFACAMEGTQTPVSSVTEVAPISTIAPMETQTPQPQVSTQEVPGGPDVPIETTSSTWPDIGSFPKTRAAGELITRSDIRAENVLDQFDDVDYTLRYFGKSANIAFVETSAGTYQWALQTVDTSGESAWWPKDSSGLLLDHPSTANDQDIAALTPVAGYDAITPELSVPYALGLEAAGGHFTYVARSPEGILLASFFLHPNRTGEWQYPVSAEAAPEFTIDSIGLSPEQAAAMELHAGLESSIKLDADGGYTTTVTVLNAEGNPVVQTIEVNPASMIENLTTQNKYGDTPVMTTTDGKKLYWIQEHQGWYQVEISADIHNPVFVPFDKMEVATRVVIAEYNQPFAQAALDRWLAKGGLSLSFQHLVTSVNETGGTKFGYIENRSMLVGDVTKGNSPLEVLNSWFVTTVPGGNEYEFSYIKLLNPQNPLAPKGDEWIALPVATGEEIVGNEANRTKFNELWQQATQPGSRLTVVPIVKAEGNFFKDTNGLITFGTAQPSLAKLLALSGNEFGNLDNPNLDGFTFSYWLDQAYNMVGPTSSSSYGVYFENNNPDYKDNFLPDEVQTIVFPSLVIQR